MAPGATQLVLIWSRDHSHAKLLVSWFNAPAYIYKINKQFAHENNYNIHNL